LAEGISSLLNESDTRGGTEEIKTYFDYNLKPKFIEKTESIKQESLNDEINNVDLPLKDAPSYTIESNQLTFKVCDEEN